MRRVFWDQVRLTCLAVLLLAGCGQSTVARKPLATRLAGATPTLAEDTLLARRAGPGSLDYCPLHDGRRRARYQVDQPGNPIIGGWCQTHAVRGATADLITFGMHWDARRLHGPTGTQVLTYSIKRVAPPGATAIPVLTAQSGKPPP